MRTAGIGAERKPMLKSAASGFAPLADLPRRVSNRHRARGRDAQNPSHCGVRPDSRDREVELFGARIPHRLFDAIGHANAVGRIEEYICQDREGARRLVDLDQCTNGGVGALLIARISPSFGSYASSSVRVGSPAQVVTSLTVVGGLVLRSKVSTRLGAAVTKSHGN